MKLQKTAHQQQAAQAKMAKNLGKKRDIVIREVLGNPMINSEGKRGIWIRSSFKHCKNSIKQGKSGKHSEPAVVSVVDETPVGTDTPTTSRESTAINEQAPDHVEEPVAVYDTFLDILSVDDITLENTREEGNVGDEPNTEVSEASGVFDNVLQSEEDFEVSETSGTLNTGRQSEEDPEISEAAGDVDNEHLGEEDSDVGSPRAGSESESIVIGVNAVSMEDYLDAVENEREEIQAEANAQIADLYQQLGDLKSRHRAAEDARKMNLKKMLRQKQLRIAAEKDAEREIMAHNQRIGQLHDRINQLTKCYEQATQDCQALESEKAYLRFLVDTKANETQAACREGEAKRLADYDSLIKDYNSLLDSKNFLEQENQKMQLSLQSIKDLSNEHSALVAGLQSSTDQLRDAVDQFFYKGQSRGQTEGPDSLDFCEALLSINKDLIFTAASTTVIWRNAMNDVIARNRDNSSSRIAMETMQGTIEEQKAKISDQLDKICDLEMEISHYEKMGRIEAPLRLATESYVKRWQELMEEPASVNAQEIVAQMTYWQQQAEIKYEALENLATAKAEFQRKLDAAYQNVAVATHEATWSGDQARRLEQAESVVRAIKEREPGKWDELVAELYNVAVMEERTHGEQLDHDAQDGAWSDDDEFF